MPIFVSDPRNLLLAVSTNKINPHALLVVYIVIVLLFLRHTIFYPWLYMKLKFVMLSLLIFGPQQSRNDIDVYLAPLIEDLRTLWDVRVEAYDAN